jgi:hypothetical protein
MSKAPSKIFILQCVVIGVCLLVLGCSCAPAPNDAPTTKAVYSTKAPSAASTAKSAPAVWTPKGPMVNGTMKLQCTTKLTPGTNKTMTVCVNATTIALKATTPAIKASNVASKAVTPPALKTATLTVKTVTPAVAVKTTAPPSKMNVVTGNGMTTTAAHMNH